jgi:hypothetical protein
MRGALLFATIALIPALSGPVSAHPDSVEIALCQGGTLTIPLDHEPAAPAAEPCCAKGCHAQRKRPLAKARD